MQIKELDEQTNADGFWDDPKNGKVIMRKLRDVKSWVTAYDEIVKANDDLGVLFEFAKEGEAEEEEVDKQYETTIQLVEDLEFRNMLHEEADQMSCVLKINSGAGGTESQDWAQMLMRMYMRYAESHNYKVRISNLLEGDKLVSRPSLWKLTVTSHTAISKAKTACIVSSASLLTTHKANV